MSRYAVVRGGVTVTARSAIHDTRTTWSAVAGWIDIDPAVDPAAPAGASAELRVDMRAFDAGDRLKNWKLRGELDADRWPEARFVLRRLERVAAAGTAGRLSGDAVGVLDWRGREVEVRARGETRLGADRLEADASFDLDVRDLGITPPRFLVFAVAPEVRVQVRLEAASSNSGSS